MLFKSIVFVALLSICSKIAGQEDLKFRFDYSFSEQADGWLKFHRVPATWNDAKLRCHSEGAILASPLTNQLQEAIVSHVSKEPIAEIFTGVHAGFSEGDFASIDGVPFSRLPITLSADESKGITKNCLKMKTRDASVATVQCGDILPYVCHKKRTELSITECGTHDKGYKLNPGTGSCYKLHWRGLSWPKAYMTCAGEGGHLAVINSVQESFVLKDLIVSFRNQNLITNDDQAYTFVGVRDFRDGGGWFTIHGETLQQAGFDHWFTNVPGYTNQPDNSTAHSSTGEDCASLYMNGLLFDMWCESTFPFICEMKPNSLES